MRFKCGWQPAALAKVIGSTILFLSTLGFLWQGTRNQALWPTGDPASAGMPLWIATAADGWYPPFLDTLGGVFQRSPLGGLAYLLVAMLCLVSLFAIPFISHTFTRVALSILLIIGITYDLTLYDIAGNLPNRETTRTVFSNIRFGLDGTAQAYGYEILRNVVLGATILVVFCLRPPRSTGQLAAGCVALTGIGVIAILVGTHGYTNKFPSPLGSYINLYVVLQKEADRPLPDVSYAAPLTSTLHKIVLIVDESVRGDYVSLDAVRSEGQGLALPADTQIIDFGIATSAANCSTEARSVLRFGPREDDLGTNWEMIRSRTSIWQYAKHAGFKTVYIDSFGTATEMLHAMTPTERSSIDDRIVMQESPVYRRDAAVSATLRRLIREPAPMFIFVEKYGVHIPYDKMYPPEANVFGAKSDRFSLGDRTELIKHYKNAIAWSVHRFLADFLAGGMPPDTLVLYTSDHGQTLSEGQTHVSHCLESTSASKSEALVPMVAISSSPSWTTALLAAVTSNFGHVSHFEIFPTMLLAMGYSREWVSDKFGYSILSSLPSNRRRRFWAVTGERIFDDP